LIVLGSRGTVQGDRADEEGVDEDNADAEDDDDFGLEEMTTCAESYAKISGTVGVRCVVLEDALKKKQEKVLRGLERVRTETRLENTVNDDNNNDNDRNEMPDDETTTTMITTTIPTTTPGSRWSIVIKNDANANLFLVYLALTLFSTMCLWAYSTSPPLLLPDNCTPRY
jgi:hypothetical protein